MAKTKALTKRIQVNILPTKRLKDSDLNDATVPTLHRAVLKVPQALAVEEALASIQGRPLADRVLVLPLPNDERYGSIMVPSDSQEEQTCGLVVGVGRGRHENGVLIPPEVSPGNYVAFARFAGRKVFVGDIELREIFSEDILFAAGKHDAAPPPGPETDRP